jgi:hypothetical protein
MRLPAFATAKVPHGTFSVDSDIPQGSWGDFGHLWASVATKGRPRRLPWAVKAMDHLASHRWNLAFAFIKMYLSHRGPPTPEPPHAGPGGARSRAISIRISWNTCCGFRKRSRSRGGNRLSHFPCNRYHRLSRQNGSARAHTKARARPSSTIARRNGSPRTRSRGSGCEHDVVIWLIRFPPMAAAYCVSFQWL